MNYAPCEHGEYTCKLCEVPAWEEQEREAFENSGILSFFDGPRVSMEPESVFKWHISRMKVQRMEAWKDGHDDYIENILPVAIEEARQDERAALRERIEAYCEHRVPGIKNCPMDPLGQCHKCQGKAEAMHYLLASLEKEI